MSMPPSGVEGCMDEQSVIEAEIQLELENINLDDEVHLDNDIIEENELPQDIEENELDVDNELENYIKRLQDQSNKFEQELLECDELLAHTSKKNDTLCSALIPYEDHNLLIQLAKEQGCDVEQYKRQILEEIENDEVIINDELADLIGDTATNGEQYSIREAEEIGANGEANAKLPVQIEKAVKDGIDYEEVPVSQELVVVNGDRNTNTQLDIQKMLREQLDILEHRYQEKIDRIKKDEAHKRNEEEVRERRTNEERQWKLQEIQRQEQQLLVEQEIAENQIKKEQELSEKEMQENMRKFQEEMCQLQNEMERQKKEYDMSVEMERKRQEEKQEKAVLVIQRTYRGYRVRKEAQPLLTERREVRKKEKEELRIKELEIEIEKRKAEHLEKEEQERKRQEEEKRQKEELKRQKEEEKKRQEEEKRRKKEEEERIKQEEKKRKEEEKQRRKEEEKRRKEEEKRKKEEEDQRKKEEKRLKEEEEKKRKEEEKRQKEEEKKRKEEEKRLKEEEKKKEKERQLEEERRKKEEEIRLKEEMSRKVNDESNVESLQKNETVNEKNKTVLEKGNDPTTNNISEESYNMSHISIENSAKGNRSEAEVDKANSILESSVNNRGSKDKVEDNNKISVEGANDVDFHEVDHDKRINIDIDKEADIDKVPKRPKTPRSARTPRNPKPLSAKKDKKESKIKEEKNEQKEVKADILPDHLESLRLRFIKECIPWSKVSNEPWKLKAGVSRKPLRRPSSAKKMPLLPEDVIIQAARVASLKMVTTVELKDLPGNNISTLGQCGGLKYLTLNNCTLVAIDGLSQCRHLQYVDVQNNKIEYVDLKDSGQLQYLNLSHNKLSSIHGLDNCTNLRWLDLSHNNITRLGGMDTMRRLHTLKISHNQLISTQGLGATPTVQMIDISHNHLQSIEDLDKLCLLFTLDASSNNLLQIPSLHNQVLLIELLLSDNSISSLSVLAAVWLPLLANIQLQQNSISELPSLQNCLLLKELNLSENQITDLEMVQHCVESCFYLEQLHLMDNPVVTDIDDSFISKLKCSCPRISSSLDLSSDCVARQTPVKPRTSFEAMCLTQLRTLKDITGHFDQSFKSKDNNYTDHSEFCDIHYKFCDRTFNIAVEYRYAHEYGEVTVPMPTAPTAPKSGRPVSSRQREKFMNPKEMFENALKSSSSDSKSVSIAADIEKQIVNGNPKDLLESALTKKEPENKTFDSEQKLIDKIDRVDDNFVQPSFAANPRDLFEQALKSADKSSNNLQITIMKGKNDLTNGHTNGNRGQQVENFRHRKEQEAAICIQAVWRGYTCRKYLIEQFQGQAVTGFDPAMLEQLNKCAVKIQASWRGYILRKKLLAALEYAQCDFDDDENDDDAMDFGDEFDLNKFVDIDEGLLDTDWKPPATPDIPSSYAVLKKPPSGKPRVPPLNTADLRPPSNPRRAWRNADSPMSDLAKIPRPPSSVASTELTFRSGVSRKEERMAEEWGFKDSGTAHLMMQRAKKMKLNAERRNKIKKLDPKQRLALFRKLEEVTHPHIHTVPQRKTLPRKEYFQARHDEIVRQEREKQQEISVKASRTFEWLHSQVGDHPVSDSVINQGLPEGPKYVPLSEKNLPELINGGKRVQLISSPMSMELQSMESASMTGHKQRRFSAGSGSGSSKLPPIQPTTPPTSAPHLKERMSFRNPKVNQSVGWGGGKKRGHLY